MHRRSERKQTEDWGTPPPVASPAPVRTMLAMKFGDHCWIKNLESRPDLNGYRVVLWEWVDAKQRWRCKPQDWKHGEEYLAIRPKNLSKDPVEPTIEPPLGGWSRASPHSPPLSVYVMVTSVSAVPPAVSNSSAMERVIRSSTTPP